MLNNFVGKDIINIGDMTPDQFQYLLDLSKMLKAEKMTGVDHARFHNKNVVAHFEWESTRTRCAFETSCHDLGLGFTYLSNSHFGNKETVKDSIRVFSEMYDAIVLRAQREEAYVREVADIATIPVINACCEGDHPTQMLADFMTMKENFGTLEGLTLAYCGQGRNNVQNSLMITSAILGVNYVNATPAELEPDPAIVEVARAFAAESGATITVTNDPVEAVENADAIYTNVWAAMGEESQFAERVKLMSPYQVNAELLSHVKNPDYIFLHCLPAFHNAETEYAADMAERFGVKEMEVTDEVFYSDHGRQFQQAENRMHTIKAIMAATLGDLYIPCV